MTIRGRRYATEFLVDVVRFIVGSTVRTAIGLTVLGLLGLLGGCTSQPDPCAGWVPIRPEAADLDAISDGLTEQILAHNQFGERACGWQP